MNFDKFFENKAELSIQLNKFVKNHQLKKISQNPLLVEAHIAKAHHNMRFFTKNLDDTQYTDWLIVTLYYTLYHCALALLVHKNYMSKNHTATILLLIKEYSISQNEVELINELSVSKDDAELYTNLKFDRHEASYTTDTKFDIKLVKKYQKQVILFMQKAEEMLFSR